MSHRATYFEEMQTALKNAAVYQPILVIDLDRLNKNIDLLMSHLPEGMGYRIVAKSLPCPKLIAHIREKSGTDRLMTFNLPMLLQLAELMPDANQLLGKPLPSAALHDFLQRTVDSTLHSVHWLIDTPERLYEYDSISEELGKPVNVVLELDVGLHRGGFDTGIVLQEALVQLKQSNRLTFTGFMGYEPHIASIPAALGWQERALKSAWSIYQQALNMAGEVFGDTYLHNLIRNAAGSPTYRLYPDTQIANEVSVGSTLVKPTHFDTPLLEHHLPASFIATPVLKCTGETQIPAFEFADGITRTLKPQSSQTFFIHGGNWLADPVDPPGLSYNKIFGRSSNQEMLNGPKTVTLQPDDFVFLRPHQSEAVFLQFGKIAIYQNKAIVDWWDTFPVSA